MTTPTRELHTGWAVHGELPDTFLVYTECADERTEILVHPPQVFKDALLVEPVKVASAPAYRLLVAEHRSRCSACMAWESDA